MGLHKISWNRYYQLKKKENDDDWLDKYSNAINEIKKIKALDLGCGNGSNIPFLLKSKANIVACDYSEQAIQQVKNKYKIETAILDMRNKLPFEDNEFNVIICDLSLHYFTERETIAILHEINRILSSEGCLYVRVNSINDSNYGAKKGKEIEKHYYSHMGKQKRFFDEDDIDYFFLRRFTCITKRESTSNKYGEIKNLWELALKKST